MYVSMHVLVISSMQKVADDKGMKAKKAGPKGKKDDGPAQNGETKTNEVWRGKTAKKEKKHVDATFSQRQTRK